MLFTAIAATVVMLPWAITGLPGDDDDAAVRSTPRNWRNSR